MSTQTKLPQTTVRRPTTESNRERQVVFTANGSTEASRRIHRTGALVGFESLNIRPPEDVPVDFVDWPFSKIREMEDPDFGELFDHHLGIVKTERPRLAVAPDVNDFTNFEDAVAWGDELRRYAETVIMVPKAVHPTDVPSRFRVGMPCQERFGPPPWKWRAYRTCGEVHLLGGSPVTHHEVVKYVPVESVDTSVPVTSAGWGDYWNGRKWQNIARDEEFFYECLERSYRNMRHSMNPNRTVWDPRCRNQRLDYEEAFVKEYPDADCWEDETAPSRFYEMY
jgi:hypothetical protein